LTSDATVALSDVRIGGRRIVLTPHNCFACGSLNVHGLHLDLHAGGDRCWTELALPERFEGWEGMAHGGIVCTILDEVMAWALVDHDVGRDRADERRVPPARSIGRPIRAEGRVIDARRRLVTAEGVILDRDDGRCSRGRRRPTSARRRPAGGAQSALPVPDRPDEPDRSDAPVRVDDAP
jgi:hypothetical protein